MAEKKRRRTAKPEYKPGTLDNMAPPNEHVQFCGGRMGDVLRPDGSSAFVKEHDCRGADTVFKVTMIDPFLLERLCDEDKKLQKIGASADAKEKWTPSMLERAEKEVDRIFEEVYLPKIFEEWNEIRRNVAEYALLRSADQLDSARIAERIRAFKLKR